MDLVRIFKRVIDCLEREGEVAIYIPVDEDWELRIVLARDGEVAVALGSADDAVEVVDRRVRSRDRERP